MSTAVIAPPLPEAPYRGIEPFRFTDQQIFAAREEETWELLSNVTLYRAVLLYGESGTGKSSLVNAGFLPKVLKENYVPDRIRVQPIAGREFKVERIRMSTVGDQATYLPSNFAPSDDSGPEETFELSLKDFRARLEEFRPEASEDSIGGLFVAPRSAPRPLLIFDQFEEFITLFEEAQRVGTSAETNLAISQVPAAQQDILATLVELIQDETLPVKIIFSFREDYLAKLSILFDLCPELLDQSQRLLPPGIEALAEIIRKPFTDSALRAHFLQQKDGTGSELSEELAEEIAGELGRRSKGDTANLTELQIVCQRLWEAKDPEKLFADNGIEGLLKSYGTDVFLHFSPELRDVAVVLLSHMITASNTRNIISEEDLKTRANQEGFQASQCGTALTALSKSQIVRREPRHSIYFYEITSEYLVPWIQERVAERNAIQSRREAEEERLEALLQESKKRRTRLLTRLVAVLMVLLMGALALSAVAFVQNRNAKKAEARATAQALEQADILTSLVLVTSQKPDEVILGIERVKRLIRENKIPSNLASVVMQPASTNKDERVRDAGSSLLAEVAKTDSTVAKSIEIQARQLPPRFFIHIGGASQREKAEQLANILRKQGYLVPGIQDVGTKAPQNNELRYFRDSEPGMPTPKEIQELLNRESLDPWALKHLKGYEESTKVIAGQYEIWFGAPADSKNGWLMARPVDENDIRIRMPFAITVNSASGELVKKLRSGYLSLESGNYTLIANSEGYEQLVISFSIEAREETEIKLKFIKKPGIQRLQ